MAPKPVDASCPDDALPDDALVATAPVVDVVEEEGAYTGCFTPS